MHQRAQGAMEYLLIVGAAVLVVAVAIVGISSAVGVGKEQSGISVLDYNSSLRSLVNSVPVSYQNGIESPSNLLAVAVSSSQINLSWDPIPEAVSYNIYRSLSSSGAFSLLSSSVPESFDNTGLSPSTAYFYKVSAVDINGTESPLSGLVSATTFGTGGPTVPAAPSNLVASAVSSSQINLSWSDNSSDESNFFVEQSTDSINFVQITSVGANVISFPVTGLSPATIYYYRVRASNSAGASAYSAPSSATTLKLVPSLSLTILPSASVSAGTLTTVTGSGCPLGLTCTLARNGSNVSNPDVNTLTAGTYDYNFFTTGNAQYNSGYSAATLVVALGAPPAPTGLAASASSSSQINLSWNPVSGAASYKVYRSPSASGTYSLIASGVASAAYQNTGLSASTTYYYKVSAVNAAGESTQSATASATTSAASGSLITMPGTLTLTPRSAASGFQAWDFTYSEPGWSTTMQGIIYKPTGSGPFPAVLISHGSGGSAIAFGLPKASSWFGPDGYLSIAPDYTHTTTSCGSTCAGSPENVKRATKCLDILRSTNLSSQIGNVVDTGNLFMYGNSMGAFVTIETSEDVGTLVKASATTAGGISPSGTPSGSAGVSTIAAPFLHMHGTADTTVVPANEQTFSNALDTYGKVHQLVWYPGAPHNIHSDSSTSSTVRDFILAWFDAYRNNAAPKINDISPSSGSVGSITAISGTNLGTNVNNNSSVIFSSNKAASTTSWGASSISATVPAGAVSGSVKVKVPLGPVTASVIQTPVYGGAESNAVNFNVN